MVSLVRALLSVLLALGLTSPVGPSAPMTRSGEAQLAAAPGGVDLHEAGARAFVTEEVLAESEVSADDEEHRLLATSLSAPHARSGISAPLPASWLVPIALAVSTQAPTGLPRGPPASV